MTFCYSATRRATRRALKIRRLKISSNSHGASWMKSVWVGVLLPSTPQNFYVLPRPQQPQQPDYPCLSRGRGAISTNSHVSYRCRVGLAVINQLHAFYHRRVGVSKIQPTPTLFIFVAWTWRSLIFNSHSSLAAIQVTPTPQLLDLVSR
jgi:hypothetical protein